MAKIFRTEALSVNGDNIRLTADTANNFAFTQSDGTVVMSNATINSDISSLSAVDVELDSDVSSLSAVDVELDSDVSSLSAMDLVHDSDISSLSAVDVELDSDVSSLSAIDLVHDSDISSLSAVDVEQDSDISSLDAKVSTNDVFSSGAALAQNDTAATVTWPSVTYATAPAVVGTLRSSGASDPILAAQLSGAPSTTQATFVFSDEVPSDNYRLDIMVSV